MPKKIPVQETVETLIVRSGEVDAFIDLNPAGIAKKVRILRRTGGLLLEDEEIDDLIAVVDAIPRDRA